ncbi:pantetheine-phosphate adenylyltransferase [Patescibacteria group bacterium]
MVKKYSHLVLAGTFDHFHLGHQQFVKNAFSQAKKISCGITTGWANKDKMLVRSIQPFSTRHKTISSFVKQQRLEKKVNFFSLMDPFGPAILKNDFDAIAATPESIIGAKLVNKKRKKNGLKPLPIYISDLINASDHHRISSSRIRFGQINRAGLVYNQELEKRKTLYLPKNKRYLFKKPIGTLITGSSSNHSWAILKAKKWLTITKPTLMITVGDITTQAFLEHNINPQLTVFDYRCQRQPISFNLHHKLKKRADFKFYAKNYPGTVSLQSIKKIQSALFNIVLKNKSGLVQIQGEEDLLVLPLILLAPLKTAIFYGQPNQGLVKVLVTEKRKETALKLINQLKF